MKRFRIVNLALMTIITAATLTLTSCSATSMVEKGQEPPTNIPSYSKTQQLDTIVNLGSIKIRIDSVSMIKNTTESQPDLQGHLALGLEVGNISSESVRFYPEQIVVTTNTGEQLLADMPESADLGGLLGGVFPPKRILQGYVMFPLQKSSPTDISEITILIKAPQNEKDQPLGDDHRLVIPIQQS
ncbi:hypothetical protein [Desulfosporosinus nitroreducens]|uniref:DUF4352 domain-containing protein n=1 Tax=Desulfosporosinus nitroreducens TaxID=2018668 RepID=A0ABT8QPP7_9FIRM|nr:hypothetical protein [Desulfosporosinus nitroreducens]MCO1601784.1 hypothetical protein [Desulfosporosinus nitroreducens]MDO0823327.1 hypothetical protein [Desulfosporosinus nitroreducens]